MNKVFPFFLILLIFGQCRKDDPLPEIASIIGVWKMTAYSVGDSLVSSSKEESLVRIIRPDGVIVDDRNSQGCCPPSKYFFNGKEFVPKPSAPIEPMDCRLVSCYPCIEMKITTPNSDPNTLAIECDGRYTMFARVK